ncbi:universal stress protein [Leptolyngbya sp. KIOST-1]|uniref:universal stress protein n=1 Tax=Leptolyngbya sp. KIOST-1 TaxID=1229172 RepID=UPI0005626083|nr:universal stress protein [Leptolyngbya sp. KIOST-1]
MNYHTILVALDRTAASDRVFDYALGLAEASQGQLRLVHSLPVKPYENLGKMIDAGVGLRSSSQVQHDEDAAQLQQLQEARTWLERLRNEALRHNIPTDFVCEVADPGALICQLATAWGADVVVVGHSGKRGLKKLILGSVSDHVANHAPCPTVVVPNDSSLEVEVLQPKLQGSV